MPKTDIRVNHRTMSKSIPIPIAIMLAALVCAGAFADTADLDRAFATLRTYEWGQSKADLFQLDQVVRDSQSDPALQKDLEKRCIAVLESDATRGGKQYACRQLRLIGTNDAVPALAGLLTNAELSHMARYGLQGIGTPEATAAIRAALGKTEGDAQAGIITSLGALGDATAVPELIPLLNSPDASIAAAAASALGRIATPKAVDGLSSFSAKAPSGLRAIAYDAYLAGAGRLMANGETQHAARIFQQLYADSSLTPSVRVAAFTGLIRALPKEASEHILSALAGNDERLRRRAGRLAGEYGVTAALAAGLAKLPPAGQAELLAALQYRADPAAHDAVLAAMNSQDEGVRVAAIAALSTTGRPADIARLTKLAIGDATAERLAAHRSLVELRGGDVDQTLIAALPSADAKSRGELISVLNARKVAEAVPAVVDYLKDPDEDVRTNTAMLLGNLGDAKQAEVLAQVVVTGGPGIPARHEDDRVRAADALSRISSRDGEGCSPIVLAALKDAQGEGKLALLRLLSIIATDDALQTLRASAKSNDTAVRDAAIDTLSRWPDDRAIPDLTDIVENDKTETHYVVAYRGYVRLLRSREVKGASEVQALSQLMALARRPEERKLVVAALAEIRRFVSFELLTKYLDDPTIAPEASAAVVAMAPAVSRNHREAVIGALSKVLAAKLSDNDVNEAQRILKELQP